MKPYGIICLFICLALPACSRTNSSSSAIAPQAVAPQSLSATQLRSLFAGNTWRWVNSTTNTTGVTIFAADGTSVVEVAGKGSTRGTWSTMDGKLCESFAPAPFLPKGMPQSCKPVSGSNNNYQVGQAIFTPA